MDFVDIDFKTYNMSVSALKNKLETTNQLPKIVIPVHFAGQSCEMQEIHTLSKQYGFKIIEDASHAIGGSYQHKKVGNGEYSDITVFSFHPVKIITTGEGGMAVTNDEELAERMRRYRTHGITSKKELMEQRPEEEIWNYQQIDLGYNYRMTDIHAAMGISQMKRIGEFVKWRREIAKRYDNAFKTLDLVCPWQHPDTESSYHLYPIRVKNQKQFYQKCWDAGIGVNLHYIPVHRQPFYERMGFKAGYFPEAELFHKEVISLPIFSSLDIDLHAFVIDTVKDFYES